MTGPVRFAFGLHLHQPWGNFEHVFRDHVDQVYRPTLAFFEERDLTPFSLHVSGPLLEWLEVHDRPLHERIGRLADEGNAELLTAGFYEPILAALDPPDRARQLQWMDDYLLSRFGFAARSSWLTERVFESELVGDLARAGIENLLVDDWHLMAAGIPRDALHRIYRTEGGEHELALVPIHEELRYMVPFRPVSEVDGYLRSLAGQGVPMAVLGDDGEKFGGWPGTRKRVWEEGWIEQFAQVLERLRDESVIRFVTVATVVEELGAGGLAYPPSSSYREMGEWALPPELVSSEHPFETAPWRNFLVRYPEANLLHKKARALSRICRQRGDPADARRAIGRAQCNDPYWHGVFGGIYMKHLRDAAWHQLAVAESLLRKGEKLQVERLDLDLDGEEEIWVHSSAFSALVGARSGRIKELTRFHRGVNHADVLTRRQEAYHGPAVERGRELAERGVAPGAGAEPEQVTGEEGGASIHEMEHSYVLFEAPLLDREDRSLLVERVLAADVTPDRWEAQDCEVLWSWAGGDCPGPEVDVTVDDHAAVLSFRFGPVRRQLAFGPAGDLSAHWEWDAGAFPAGARFTVELSLAHRLDVTAQPHPDVWRYPVVTVPRSERGFERITQGESVTVVWPVEVGRGEVRLRAV